tara:strand:- start:16452 stop:17177 length:726 start_codon:yes stop_codon:yes gene_type:complete
MNGKEARGMPNVELSIQTKEELAERSRKIPQDEMFKGVEASTDKPNVELTITDTDKPKKKKQLTEKQLEALNRGRQKSIETRRLKKEQKLKEEAEWKAHKEETRKASQKVKEFVPPPPQEEVKSSADFVPTPSMPPQMYNQPNFSIDYDKLVNGVVEQMENRSKARQEREHKVATDLSAYEAQIREDERNKMLSELEQYEKEEARKKNLAGATNVLKHKSIAPHHLSTYQGSRQGRSRRVW